MTWRHGAGSQNAGNDPGDDSKRFTPAWPRSQRNALAANVTNVANAVPCALRHIVQWQCAIHSSAPSMRQATSPQRHRPCTFSPTLRMLHVSCDPRKRFEPMGAYARSERVARWLAPCRAARPAWPAARSWLGARVP